MKRSTRIISAIIALLFLLGVIFTIIITVSYAMPKGEEAVYTATDTDGTSMLSGVSLANPENPLVFEFMG